MNYLNHSPSIEMRKNSGDLLSFTHVTLSSQDVNNILKNISVKMDIPELRFFEREVGNDLASTP